MTTFRWSDEERLLLGMTERRAANGAMCMTGRGISRRRRPAGAGGTDTVAPGVAPAGNEVDAAGNSWCCEYDERGNLLR